MKYVCSPALSNFSTCVVLCALPTYIHTSNPLGQNPHKYVCLSLTTIGKYPLEFRVFYGTSFHATGCFSLFELFIRTLPMIGWHSCFVLWTSRFKSQPTDPLFHRLLKYIMVFLHPSSSILGRYLKQSTTVSFYILSNRLSTDSLIDVLYII
jgi:hypothetical protein